MREKLKVMTIVGTRPEIIKLSEVIKMLDKYFNHILVHTGQNWDYTLNKIFFDDLKLREPNYFLNSVGQNLGETMGNILTKSYDILNVEKPDAVLILGDTNSALSAICAKRLKVPIFHMEAGNRCFDQNVPEESNRKIVDHISDINLAYTEHARRNLLNEGLSSEYVFVTGSPMKEVIDANIKGIENSDILDKLQLKRGKYFVVSAHREENIDNLDHFISLMNAVNYLAEDYGIPIVFSTHPRTKNTIEKRSYKFHKNVSNLAPLGFMDYINLQKNAFCVLSDSGTLAEESSILGFPCVSIRTSSERPEVLDKGTFILGGLTTEEIIQAVNMVSKMTETRQAGLIANDYQDENTSVKIARIIQSYTKIINNNIWRKK